MKKTMVVLLMSALIQTNGFGQNIEPYNCAPTQAGCFLKLDKINAPLISGRTPELKEGKVFKIEYVNPCGIYMPDKTGKGIIKGTIIESETGEPLPFAIVMLTQDGVRIKNTQSDYEGKFFMNEVPAGVYELKVHYLSLQQTLKVDVKGNKNIQLNIDFETTVMVEPVVITGVKKFYERRCCFCWPREIELIREYPKDTTENDTALAQMGSPSDMSLRYFPNPTAGPLTIEIIGKINDITLHDASGRIIDQYYNTANRQLNISLDTYAPGFYFIKYREGIEMKTGKIIVAR
jgi:hypothetical protein